MHALVESDSRTCCCIAALLRKHCFSVYLNSFADNSHRTCASVEQMICTPVETEKSTRSMHKELCKQTDVLYLRSILHLKGT